MCGLPLPDRILQHCCRVAPAVATLLCLLVLVWTGAPILLRPSILHIPLLLKQIARHLRIVGAACLAVEYKDVLAHTTVYLVNGVLMAAIFFGCRIVGMAVLLYMMFIHYPATTGNGVGDGLGGGLGHVVAPATVTFYFLNVYWVYRILRGVIDKLVLKKD